MRRLNHFAFFLSLTGICVVFAQENAMGEFPWTWVCKNEICLKTAKADLQPFDVANPASVCKLNCHKYGALWPLPTGKISLGKDLTPFYASNMVLQPLQAPSTMHSDLEQAYAIFKNYMGMMSTDSKNNSSKSGTDSVSENSVLVTLAVAPFAPNPELTLTTDESCLLSIQLMENKKIVSCNIQANSYFGARHCLETLSQLIAYDNEKNCLQIVNTVTIQDKPFFPYRGILLDTSRNFIPMNTLRRLIDGMSYNKLNMFHWHITDTHSFPMYSKSMPQLTQYGAYSFDQVYSIEDMKSLVEYARIRGVKVVPEFDAPAHVGNGWQWGPKEGKGNLAVCVNKEPWYKYCVEPPCGQLNPVNEAMYDVLGHVYKDMLDYFPNDLFHMGGDEVNVNCWNSSSDITSWMLKNKKNRSLEDYLDLWGSFQERAYSMLSNYSKAKDMNAILWTSELTGITHVEKYLPKSKYIIQLWTTGSDPLIPFLLGKGYRVIFSNYDAWYFDCGFGAWIGNGATNWCSPYKGWQQVYMNNPVRIYQNVSTREETERIIKKGLILGGEAALWTEQADHATIESRIWPRGAALAERLWSNPSTNWVLAENRMFENRNRMQMRNLNCDQIQPQWCYQNEGYCRDAETAIN